MGKLTTHVLDTASGNPAYQVRIRLFRDGEILADVLSNRDGRSDVPLLDNALVGRYELLFSMGAYFRAQGVASPFLDEIPIHFLVEAGRNYHIPLACSPYAYSTYRGS